MTLRLESSILDHDGRWEATLRGIGSRHVKKDGVRMPLVVRDGEPAALR